MIRILCIAALLVAVGADDHDSWKHSMKRFFDNLNRDIDDALRKSVHVPTKAPYSSTPAASSTTPSPTSGCASSTASSTYQPTSSTAADCEPTRSTPVSSTHPYPVHVGSIKGIPGIHFPDYTDIPLTSFSCSDKDYIPGFYADMETGCQVFHVCWPHRRESFLCPLGTIFNQALLACDYWYSSNCSLASIYYNVNSYSAKEDSKKDVGSMVNILLGAEEMAHSGGLSKDSSTASSLDPDAVLSFISQFLPVKAKVTVYPESVDTRSKIVATASVGKVKHRDVHYGKHTHKSSAKKLQSTSTTTATPEIKYSTQAPETPSSSYAELEQSVKLILNEVFQTVQNVIKNIPRYQDSEKPVPPTHEPSAKKLQSTSTTTAIPEIKYATQAPETPSSSYAQLEQSVKLILNEVFQTIQNVIKDIPRYLDSEKPVPQPHEHLPLTKLDPRFIVEPITFPGKVMPSSVTPTPADVKSSKSTDSEDYIKKPVKEITRYSELRVSPMTKTALTTNYLRLLKIRKA